MTTEPTNLAEIATILRDCDERGVAVEPKGSGTKQPWLVPSDRESLTLRTTHFKHVLEHPWQDMTCTVEAGCSWSALQNQLAQHGQRVALDPLWPTRATVGGIVSANDSGALRHRYGGLRDLVLGMTVVLADGTIARTGGKVVKNVAGYDLPKLLTGAWGTLAVIAEVTFRLHAIPLHRASYTVASANATALGQLAAAMLTSTLSIEALQLRTTPNGFALDVELAATPAVLAQQADRLAAMAAEQSLKAQLADPAVWIAREQVFEAANASESSIGFKASCTQTGVAPLLAAVSAAGGQATAQAHGILYGALPASLPPAELHTLRGLAIAHNGSLSLLGAALPQGLDRDGPQPSAFAVMQAIKQQFDPRRTLNPGRFLGGL